MTKTLPLALLLLLTAGCEAPRPDGEPRFAQEPAQDAEDDERELAPGDEDDDDRVPEGDDDDEDGLPEGDDDDDDEPEPAWDAMPPDAPDGSTLSVVMTCGLVDGNMYVNYEKRGDRWIQMDFEGNGPFPEVMPCMRPNLNDEVSLVWDEAPSLYIDAAGLDHDLTPTASEDRWFGWVAPMEEPSRECLDAVAELGLSFPVAMTLEVLEVALP